MLVFFTCGLIIVEFSSSGKHPEDMDELMIAVIIGSSWSIHFFRSHVGLGSRSQVLSGEDSITSRTSTQLAGFRSRRGGMVFVISSD